MEFETLDLTFPQGKCRSPARTNVLSFVGNKEAEGARHRKVVHTQVEARRRDRLNAKIQELRAAAHTSRHDHESIFHAALSEILRLRSLVSQEAKYPLIDPAFRDDRDFSAAAAPFSPSQLLSTSSKRTSSQIATEGEQMDTPPAKRIKPTPSEGILLSGLALPAVSPPSCVPHVASAPRPAGSSPAACSNKESSALHSSSILLSIPSLCLSSSSSSSTCSFSSNLPHPHASPPASTSLCYSSSNRLVPALSSSSFSSTSLSPSSSVLAHSSPQISVRSTFRGASAPHPTSFIFPLHPPTLLPAGASLPSPSSASPAASRSSSNSHSSRCSSWSSSSHPGATAFSHPPAPVSSASLSFALPIKASSAQLTHAQLCFPPLPACLPLALPLSAPSFVSFSAPQLHSPSWISFPPHPQVSFAPCFPSPSLKTFTPILLVSSPPSLSSRTPAASMMDSDSAHSSLCSTPQSANSTPPLSPSSSSSSSPPSSPLTISAF